MDDEDCKKWEDFYDPWAVWSRNKQTAEEEALDRDGSVTAPVLSTAHPVAALDINENDASSVISESSSLDTVTGLPRGIHFNYPPPTAATIEQRLQEAVDDFQLSWEVSRLDDDDKEVTSDQYLRLLRSRLAVCGNVAVLVLPESWKGVMDEVRRDYFPNLEELIVYRDELVGDDE